MKKQWIVLFSLSKKGYYNDRSVLLVLSSEDSNNEFLYKDYWPTQWTLFSNSGLTETEKLHAYGPLVISHIKPEQSWIKPYSGKRESDLCHFSLLPTRSFTRVAIRKQGLVWKFNFHVFPFRAGIRCCHYSPVDFHAYHFLSPWDVFIFILYIFIK